MGYNETMTSVTIDLPTELVSLLQRAGANLASEAKEALGVKLFRDGRLNHLQLSQLLGLDRFQTDTVLKRHEVAERSITFEQLEIERSTLDAVLGKPR